MAFIELDRDSQPAVFVGDLVLTVNALNNLHALLERTDERMDEMSDAQIETLYGIPADDVTAVKTAVSNAFGVIDGNASITGIRTQLG